MPPAGTRTLIRHRDVRQITPNTPARNTSEQITAQGRYFEADCLAADAVGDFVYITGVAVSGFYQVTKSDYTVASTMPVAGIITEKSTSTRCFVQTEGVWVTTGLTPQARYWVSASSQLTSTVPTPGLGQTIITQVVGQALSATDLKLTLQAQIIRRNG